MCRMCGESDETISYIVSECKKKKKKTCWIAISMLEARQGGAGDSLGPMWKAGL